MRTLRLAAVTVALALLGGQALAVEAVIVSSKLKWKCEGDVRVQLNDDNGNLRITSKSAGVDQTLQLYHCHSSHCDWGLSPGAAECGEKPCAEILAGPHDQSLMTNLKGFEKTCLARKPKSRSVDTEGSGGIPHKDSNTWVVVTRPVLSCGSMEDSEQLKETLLNALVHPLPGGALPEGCSLLSVGEKYLLDDEQTDAETQIAVKMWAGVCPKGCLPTMTPVYAPPRRLVGRYLKPTKPPPGWDSAAPANSTDSSMQEQGNPFGDHTTYSVCFAAIAKAQLALDEMRNRKLTLADCKKITKSN